MGGLDRFITDDFKVLAYLYRNKNADDKFIELYNTGLLHETIFNTLGKVSFGSLYRWRALLDYNSE